MANDKKETILLDARLESMIDNNAFGAELCNGHRLVVFFKPEKTESEVPKIGEKVVVKISPYDMSKGELVINQG
jgi:translation initiation factor IF-1